MIHRFFTQVRSSASSLHRSYDHYLFRPTIPSIIQTNPLLTNSFILLLPGFSTFHLNTPLHSLIRCIPPPRIRSFVSTLLRSYTLFPSRSFAPSSFCLRNDDEAIADFVLVIARDDKSSKQQNRTLMLWDVLHPVSVRNINPL
jgi:hypothetical protein